MMQKLSFVTDNLHIEWHGDKGSPVQKLHKVTFAGAFKLELIKSVDRVSSSFRLQGSSHLREGATGHVIDTV
jgi:hypothetical protein